MADFSEHLTCQLEDCLNFSIDPKMEAMSSIMRLTLAFLSARLIQMTTS